jgi:hypothetical protein
VKALIASGISFFFMFGGPSYLAWSGEVISGTMCMILQPFTVRGKQSYPEFWAATGDP